MESTPFDSSASPPAPDTDLPQTRAPQTPKRRVWWLVPIALLVVGLGVAGYIANRNLAAQRERQAQLAALRQNIKKVVLQDNALVLEMLDDGALGHITYAEFFKRADKNKEERDDLIRTLRATESGPYGEQVGRFVKLMEGENEWVRAEEAVSRANLEASAKWDAYQTLSDASSQASDKAQAAQNAYLAAPYGYDYAEKLDLDLARSRLSSMGEQSKNAFGEWTKAQDDLKAKKASAALTVADWVRQEPNWYPNFAPRRDIADLLARKKRDYTGQSAAGDDQTVTAPPPGATDVSTPQNATAQSATGASATEATAMGAPQAAPTPSVPTRVHTLEDLPGERFPQTRTRDLSAEEISELSDEDVRYAINEMFARYGMTFRDKDLQAEFEPYKWYRPNEKWTPGQIERAFSKREKHNADLLAAERNDRKNISDEE